MYRVEINGNTVIHQPDGGPRKLQTGVVKRSINAINSFEFSLTPANVGYSIIQPLTTTIEVTRTDKNRIIFAGRVLQPTETLDSSGLVKSFVCQDALGYLHDVALGYQTITGTVRTIITSLIVQYNEIADAYKQIDVGDVPDSGAYTLEVGPETDVFDTMHAFVVTDHSMEYRLRYEGDKRYLDVASKLGEQKTTPTIQVAHNLLSMSVEADPTGVVTQVIPLGAVKSDSDASSSVEKRVNLADIGKPLFIASTDLVNQFGIHRVARVYDTVTNANDLVAKANSYLSGETPVSFSYEVSAVDLSLIGKEPDTFEPYNYYQVNNPVQSISEPLRVTGDQIDIVNVETLALTIGNRYKNGADYLGQPNYGESTTDLIRRLRVLSNQVKTAEQKQADASGEIETLKKAVEALQSQISQYYEGAIIDVSYYQDTIDWAAAQAAGLALAIIRVQDGSSFIDPKYQENLTAVTGLGINYAVYAFFRGLNAADAATEATNFYNRTQQTVAGKTQPRFYCIDVEKETVTSGTMAEAVSAYMDQLNKLGVPDSHIVIYVGQYTQADWQLDVARAGSLWVPAYGTDDGTIQPAYRPKVGQDLWQYTSRGTYPGITTLGLDMSTEPTERFKNQYLKK